MTQIGDNSHTATKLNRAQDEGRRRLSNPHVVVAITVSNKNAAAVPAPRQTCISYGKSKSTVCTKTRELTAGDKKKHSTLRHPKSSTDLHGEERSAEHAHGVHVLRELADHYLHVLGDARALVEVGGELVNLTVVARHGWGDSGDENNPG